MANNVRDLGGLEPPVVSIYMPTHNRLSLLKRAVSSVLAQTLPTFELIIVNDLSSDGTAEYLDELASADARILVLHNLENMGACASRNRAIAMASGEYITGLDDDDFFLPERLIKFLQLWKIVEATETNLRGLYSNVYWLKQSDGGGRVTHALTRVTRSDLLRRNHVNSVFTRTVYMQAIGGFDPAFPAWQDYDTWYRLMGSNGCMLLEPSVSYVIDDCHHGARISIKSLTRFEQAHALFCAKHDLPPDVVATLRNSIFEHPLARMSFVNLFHQVRSGSARMALRVFVLKLVPLSWRRVLMPRPIPIELMKAICQRLEAVPGT